MLGIRTSDNGYESERGTESGVQEVRKSKKADGMASRRGIKYDAGEALVLGPHGQLDHLGDAHRLVYPRRQCREQLAW